MTSFVYFYYQIWEFWWEILFSLLLPPILFQHIYHLNPCCNASTPSWSSQNCHLFHTIYLRLPSPLSRLYAPTYPSSCLSIDAAPVVRNIYVSPVLIIISYSVFPRPSLPFLSAVLFLYHESTVSSYIITTFLLLLYLSNPPYIPPLSLTPVSMPLPRYKPLHFS